MSAEELEDLARCLYEVWTKKKYGPDAARSRPWPSLTEGQRAYWREVAEVALTLLRLVPATGGEK